MLPASRQNSAMVNTQYESHLNSLGTCQEHLRDSVRGLGGREGLAEKVISP